MIKYPMGWGNSPAVREAFLSVYNQKPLIINRDDLLEYNYTNEIGDPKLLEITKNIIKRQFNKEYNYIFVANGATGAIVITLRAYKKMGINQCLTREPPYYARYPIMIDAAGMEHITKEINGEHVIVWDIPSNPQGSLDNFNSTNPIIFDAVYYSGVYLPFMPYSVPNHNVLVGSYSKYLGLNGCRLGFIALNDSLLAERIKELIMAEYCGLSKPSMDLIVNSLEDLDFDIFEGNARARLDLNREEWSKLERFFNGHFVSNIGMFHYCNLDDKAQELFVKSGIEWTKGSLLGTSDEFARFNLGQTNQIIKNAVKEIIKNDKI